MVYLVTGGRGFIGSYVTRDLVRQGHRVIVQDTFTDDLLDSLLTPEELSEVILSTSDPSDFAQMCRLAADYRVDVLVHLTSMLHPVSNENPPLAERVNNLSFINALEVSRLQHLRLVWASSVVVFGPRSFHPVPVPNDAPHHPTTLYAECKSYNEFLANHYFDAWKVDHIGLRFTLVYGPGRTRGASAFANRSMAELAMRKPVVIPFGDDVLDWQYVEDISRLILACSQTQSPQTRIFNTRCDIRSLRELGSYVQKLIPGTQISYQSGQFGVAWELDDTALQKEIGFQCKFPMEAGVLKTINYYRLKGGLAEVAAPVAGAGRD